MPDGDNGDFELYWVPLVPRPRLVRPQGLWLEAWYEQLLQGTSTTSTINIGRWPSC